MTVQDVYLEFVQERHRIWERRQRGEAGPWSDDPILRTKKFTNVFRVLDHGSQFLLKELLLPAETFRDVAFRAFLYRYNNRPEPWERFHADYGRYPIAEDLSGLLQDAWQSYKRDGQPFFGSAYRMFVGKENAGMDRLTWLLELTEAYFSEGGPKDIVPAIRLEYLDARNPETTWELLTTIPRCGDFMAMQILTDLNYSQFGSRDMENTFVIPGPGARCGAWHLFPDRSPTDVIFWAYESLQRLGKPQVEGWLPSLMDVQNTLCEFCKYMRYLEKPVPSKDYRAAHPGPQHAPVLPPHWAAAQ